MKGKRLMKLSKLTKPELDKILQNANFTKDEEEIFLMLSKGKSITEIACALNLCNRSVNRKILLLKSKIKRLEL